MESHGSPAHAGIDLRIVNGGSLDARVPAHAGIDRDGYKDILSDGGVPRPRGDRPMAELDNAVPAKSSALIVTE